MAIAQGSTILASDMANMITRAEIVSHTGTGSNISIVVELTWSPDIIIALNGCNYTSHRYCDKCYVGNVSTSWSVVNPAIGNGLALAQYQGSYGGYPVQCYKSVSSGLFRLVLQYNLTTAANNGLPTSGAASAAPVYNEEGVVYYFLALKIG